MFDAELDEALGRVLDVEVGVFGKHAAKGVVDLGVAVKGEGLGDDAERLVG